jgi:hypothetical protein
VFLGALRENDFLILFYTISNSLELFFLDSEF